MSPDPELTERTYQLMPFARLLGIELVEASKERVEAHLEWDPDRCTSGGLMHGGAIMSLADSAGAMLAASNLPANAGTATISSSTNFIRGVSGGTAIATARLVHRGRTTIVVQTDVSTDGDRLVARVIQTHAVLQG